MTVNQYQYQYQDLLVRADDPYARAKYEMVAGYLADAGTLDVLNVGCGSGELSLRLARDGHRILGLDPEPRYIGLAEENARRAGAAGCRFVVGAIETFRAEERFDCVVAADVLEHLVDDRRALAAMVGLTRPGGWVIVTVPAGRWLFGYHDESLGHVRRYSRADLARLARDLCRVERIRYFGFSLVPVCWLYSRVLRRPYPVAEVGSRARRPVMATALEWLLSLERRLAPPTGTSLVLVGRPAAGAAPAPAGSR